VSNDHVNYLQFEVNRTSLTLTKKPTTAAGFAIGSPKIFPRL